jgi:hypothetical protein
MGLDMYLHKKTYVKNWDHQTADEKHQISIKKGGKVRKDIQPKRISSIEEEVAYWRKFNALHKWFVENVQKGVDDCGDYYVDVDKLKELLAELEKVVKDKSKAAEILPTASGFFFGGTEYDEYYFQDVKDTIKVLKELVKEEGDFYYHSSW